MDRKIKKTDKKDEFDWGKFFKGSAIWIVLILIFLLISKSMPFEKMSEEKIDYNIFLQLVKDDLIASVEIDNQTNELKGVLKSERKVLTPSGEPRDYIEFSVYLPDVDQELGKKLVDSGVKVEFVTRSDDFMVILFNVLPWILLIFIMFMFLKRMQGGGSGGRNIFNFGKSRAKMTVEDQTKVTFEDVAGCVEAKEELQEIIEFLKTPQKFTHLGGKIPKGALLLGPPGTGKTLLAKAVAGEAGVPFYSMSGADFVEMFVGVGASRVRDLFEQGKKNAPCIIFIDELDAVGRHRGAGLGGGHDEREQTLNQLLVEMDGFESNEGVILLAATNRPDVLDKALLRPGRFDRQIVVDRPDVRGREGILKVHTKNIPLAGGVDLSVIAKGSPGFSGADLANLVNESALLAARKNKKKVDMKDLEDAKDKVLMGTERKSLIISDDEKNSTAYHEAGHVLVARLTPGADPVHKVTIIPRGRALGLTTILPIDEKHNYSKDHCERTLIQLLGGRTAEKLVLNQYTTGAGNDIERATDLARKMVCEWGMSEKMGPMTFGKKQEEIFLGREIAQHRDYSELTAQTIDLEVKNIIEAAAKIAERILSQNIEMLHSLSKALLEKEVLDASDIDKVLNLVNKKKSSPKAHNKEEKDLDDKPKPKAPYRKPQKKIVKPEEQGGTTKTSQSSSAKTTQKNNQVNDTKKNEKKS
ncbi:MAG: ATP-dependent zinc metalloprotease FtsH [Calditrichia bacterium]|nr:ATP-dependent zinc metalloprotease FtsH [Calditrichia bacterium]